MGEEMPDPLGALDPAIRRRVVGQAQTIVERLLAHRRQDRPVRYRADVNFPRGTTEFGLLHRFVTDVAALVAILNEVLPTMPDGSWLRFSPADTALFRPWDDYVAVMLHPADMNVAALPEVPAAVRIFQFNLRAPFDIAEAPVFGASRVASARQQAASPLTALRDSWRDVRQAMSERLLLLIRAERDARADTLEPQVLRSIDDLLVHTMGRPGYHVMELLEVAHYLGILPQVMAALATAPADE